MTETHHIVSEGHEIGTVTRDSFVTSRQPGQRASRWTAKLRDGRTIRNLPTLDEAIRVLTLIAIRNTR